MSASLEIDAIRSATTQLGLTPAAVDQDSPSEVTVAHVQVCNFNLEKQN